MSADASQSSPPEKPDGEEREGGEPDNAGGGTTLKEAVELTGKAAAALLGILYICGLVVSALFLFPYGVYGLDLIRAHYVLAGLWILLPLLLICLIVAMVIASFDAVGSFIEADKEKKDRSLALEKAAAQIRAVRWPSAGDPLHKNSSDFDGKVDAARKKPDETKNSKPSGTAKGKKKFWLYARRVFLASLSVIVGSYVAWASVIMLSQTLGAESIAWETAAATFRMMLRWLGVLVVIVLAPIGILPAGLYGKLIESTGRRASVAMAFLGGFTLLAGGLYLADFSQSVYPKLPMTLGGGRPVIARVLIKPEAVAILEFLKNGQTKVLQSGATPTVQMDLLLETSRGYFVRVSQHPPKAALIPREVVQAVILEGNAPAQQ